MDVLLAAKLAVEFGNCRAIPRATRNIDQDLADLNLTRQQAYGLIKELTPADYSRGPESDDAQPDKEVWVFGKDIDGTEVYIKLRVVETKGIARCMVWSFHKAEYQMKYPLREGG